MSTLVRGAQHGARRYKSQGTVSLEFCQSSQCWSVIIFKKRLWGPVKFFSATKGFLGSNSSDHCHDITC